MSPQQQSDEFRIRMLAFSLDTQSPARQAQHWIDEIALAIKEGIADFDPETNILTLLESQGSPEKKVRLSKHGVTRLPMELWEDRNEH